MTEWIKICGVTSVEDAMRIADAGATAIGLNFFAQSKRYIAPAQARAIRDAVAQRLDVVGVFVNSSAEEVAGIATDVGLHAVQFHGDETAEAITDFQNRRPEVLIIRAFRVGDEGLNPVADAIGKLREAGVNLAAVLLDAHVAGEYGGTGKLIDPSTLQGRPLDWPPLILAGGLTPDTVAAAQSSVSPWGIDTASGVELSPGKKCPIKVQTFIDSAGVTNSRRLGMMA